jgi:hypothetical protein
LTPVIVRSKMGVPSIGLPTLALIRAKFLDYGLIEFVDRVGIRGQPVGIDCFGCVGHVSLCFGMAAKLKRVVVYRDSNFKGGLHRYRSSSGSYVYGVTKCGPISLVVWLSFSTTLAGP